MVGDLLPLVDRLDREGGAVAGGGGDLGGDDALLGPGVGGGELDPQPALELRLLGPDGADLRPGVATDHALIIRAASTPAFFAPSIATQATGIPGGICTAESSASSPPRLLPRIGTPITGRSVCAAATPGSAALIPAPAMITFSPRARAVVQNSWTLSGSRCALITCVSDLMPCSVRYFSAGAIFSMSFFDPMMIPTSVPVVSNSCSICSISTAVSVSVSGVMSLMWRLPLGGSGTGQAGDGAGGDVAAGLHSGGGDPAPPLPRT